MNDSASTIIDRFDFHPSSFVFPQTFLSGTITLGADSCILPMCVLRADTVPITIGERSNIQDGCIIHGDPGMPVIIGNRVTLGHAAIVHSAVIEDDVLIGIGAVVLNGAHIGHHSMIGARALVPEGMHVPPYSLVLGIPGKIRPIKESQLARITQASDHYVERKELYRRRNLPESTQ
jgi:carbonic anhydrase/acetyltransferase-like protein (isoleucine patch superfamily)